MNYDKELLKVCWVMAIFCLISVVACVTLWFTNLPACPSLGWIALLVLTVWSGLFAVVSISTLKHVYDGIADLDSEEEGE